MCIQRSVPIPCETVSLRNHSNDDPRLVSLFKCEADGGFAAMRILDAFRPWSEEVEVKIEKVEEENELPILLRCKGIQNENHSDIVHLDDGKWDWCCNLHTLPEKRVSIEDASYFSDITKVDDVFTRAISKALPPSCQARKYGSVSQDELLLTPDETAAYRRAELAVSQGRKRPVLKDVRLLKRQREKLVLLQEYVRVLLCSLLGNYPHCTRRITNREARRLLYDLLLPSSSDSRLPSVFIQPILPSNSVVAFLQAVFHQCPILVKWCIRDYFVAMLEDTPGMLEVIGDAIRFEDFKRITNEAMSRARAYLNMRLTHKFTDVGAWLREASSQEFCHCQEKQCPLPCHYEACAWLQDLRLLLDPLHTELLKKKYVKSKLDAVDWLISRDVREKHAPLVPLPRLHAEPEPERAWEVEDYVERIVLGDLATACEAETERFQERRIHQQFTATQRQHDQMEQTRFRRYVSEAQFTELVTLVENTYLRLEEIVGGFFVYFGVPETAVQRLLVLLQYHRAGDMRKKDQVKWICDLRADFPHAYNLLQITAELLHFALRPRVVGSLPKHIAEAQVKAVQRRWGTQYQVETTTVCFAFCNICGTVHSPVQDASSSDHYKYYRFGLPDVWFDYSTRQVYCRRNKINHRGTCKTVPIRCVDLLGIRFEFQSKVYQLCTECGSIMVTTRENRCKACRSHSTADIFAPLKCFVAALPARRACVACGRICDSDRNTILVTIGKLIACRSCVRRGLLIYLAQEGRWPVTEEEASKQAGKWLVQNRSQHKAKMLRRFAKQHDRQKQKDRSRRA